MKLTTRTLTAVLLMAAFAPCALFAEETAASLQVSVTVTRTVRVSTDAAGDVLVSGTETAAQPVIGQETDGGQVVTVNF